MLYAICVCVCLPAFEFYRKPNVIQIIFRFSIQFNSVYHISNGVHSSLVQYSIYVYLKALDWSNKWGSSCMWLSTYIFSPSSLSIRVYPFVVAVNEFVGGGKKENVSE